MSIQNKLERLKNKLYKNSAPQVYGARYAYVFAFTDKGKKVIDGPFNVPLGAGTCVEAEQSLAEFPSGEIFVFATRNIAKAKSEIKHILLARGENPDEALKRVLKKRSSV